MTPDAPLRLLARRVASYMLRGIDDTPVESDMDCRAHVQRAADRSGCELTGVIRWSECSRRFAVWPREQEEKPR